VTIMSSGYHCGKLSLAANNADAGLAKSVRRGG